MATETSPVTEKSHEQSPGGAAAAGILPPVEVPRTDVVASGTASDSIVNGAAKGNHNGAPESAGDMNFGIQARAMQLLALQQPMARDLRVIGSSMRIVIDLERIGDSRSGHRPQRAQPGRANVVQAVC